MEYDPKWEKLVKFVENCPEYKLNWTFMRVSEGTIDSILFNSYSGISRQQERNYDPSRIIVPVLTRRED